MAEFTPKQQRHTMYDQMEFPVADWSEFPMAVPVVDGVVQPTPYDAKHKPHPVVIVNTPEELERLKSEAPVLIPISDAPDAPSRVESEDDVRAGLYREAELAGVTVDKRWGVQKIRDAIQAAKDVV